MASFKESSHPFAQAGVPVRQSTSSSRHHVHSVSLGAVNPNHRVTRRKSMTSTAAANAAAAVAATLNGGKDSNGESVGIPMGSSSHRRGLSGRKGLESSSLGSSSGLGSYLSRSVNDHAVGRKHSPQSTTPDGNNTAVDGGAPVVGKPVSTKNRNRRASEGSHLIRGEGKRVAGELRCERCGKGYKHSSCLSKHMWEHDPAWAYTSKLLISKHQQVQLLEAATVLINMNQDASAAAAAESREAESEGSSASPAASSELRGGLSSAETTPPPMGEEGYGGGKRFSVTSNSSFSHSYQSVPSSSFTTSSAPLHSPAFSHSRQSSTDTRPSSVDTETGEDDEADLAAVIGLCNFGTPRSRPVRMSSPDVPPVPPLPARFLGQSSVSSSLNGNNLSSSAAASIPLPESTPTTSLYFSSLNPSLSYKISDEREVRMEDADVDRDQESRRRRDRNDDVDFGSSNSRHHAVNGDDDDDGVFGRMEE